MPRSHKERLLLFHPWWMRIKLTVPRSRHWIYLKALFLLYSYILQVDDDIISE